jgi:cyclophilin family peptidyl-prolyl cis-trans isomerase
MKKLLLIPLLTLTMACAANTSSKNDSPAASKDNPSVIVETSMGDIEILLAKDKAPETVKNFLWHIEQGNYDGAPFHRVIPNFMIQGGDFENKNGTGGYSYKGPGTKFKDEFHKDLRNDRGTISMANSGPNTNGSQFFINTVNNNFLDDKHSVFGEVTKGMDVVDEISQVERYETDEPVDEVLIEKITVK